MSRKKVGELYGTPIVTGNENTVENHELLLELNDDNTPKALKQRTTGDLFKSILGEGSNNNANPGYNVTKQAVTLFNDTIETQESGGIYQAEIENIEFDLIAGENYIVVFDGTSYNVKATVSPYDEDDVLLGEINGSGPSFETYPFAIMYNVEDEVKVMLLATNTEGSHTVVIKHEEETVTPTPEFKSAVDSVTGYSIDKGNETLFDGTVETVDDGGYISGKITPTITFVEDDTYKVTFNGVEYICKCFSDEGIVAVVAVGAQYGEEDLDWSTYPFNIATYLSGGEQHETRLTTSQEGSYTLKIEHLSASTKTTPGFESMIQGIVGSASGCQIIYPDSISWNSLYSQYDTAPASGNIYFIPFIDIGSTIGKYLYPVYINELTNSDNQFSGSATIIGTPIIVNNGTLTVLDFDGVINPSSNDTSGLQIVYNNNAYRLSYAERESH